VAGRRNRALDAASGLPSLGHDLQRPAGTEAHLQAQVAFAVAENSWARRAEQWNTWLSMA
jgi:hypothetical protein